MTKAAGQTARSRTSWPWPKTLQRRIRKGSSLWFVLYSAGFSADQLLRGKKIWDPRSSWLQKRPKADAKAQSPLLAAPLDDSPEDHVCHRIGSGRNRSPVLHAPSPAAWALRPWPVDAEWLGVHEQRDAGVILVHSYFKRERHAALCGARTGVMHWQ